MSSTNPIRVDGELFEAARSVGAVTSRSAAQQLSHWARIGRELENSPNTSTSEIQRILAGEPGATFDSLSVTDQAMVRANWDERVAERLATLDFAEEFAREGTEWSEADDRGVVTVHGVDESSAPGAPKKNNIAGVE